MIQYINKKFNFPNRLFSTWIVMLIAMIAMLSACNLPDQPDETLAADAVAADVETDPVKAGIEEDAADDPAIWINRSDPSGSLIVGSNKVAGIHLYSLKGNELFFIGSGRINNVDVRYDFEYNGRKIDIVGGSNRESNSIDLFELDGEQQRLVRVDDKSMVSGVDEVYGFCLYHSRVSGHHYAFINGKDGKVEQWLLEDTGDSLITGRVIRALKVETQPEGMVADDETGLLYVGEEEKGIWVFQAEPDAGDEGAFIEMSGEENSKIKYDVEGLAIFPASDTTGYLIASSQGNNSYAVFERGGEHRYITSFIVGEGSVDAVEETDGLDITAAPLNEQFPSGIFVVQDGFNFDGDAKQSQNFKLIDNRKIMELLGN